MPKVPIPAKEAKLIKHAGNLLSKKISYLKAQEIKVTQAEIAQATGKSQTTINMILQGNASYGVNVRNWNYRELMALFKILEFTKDEIRQFVKETEIDFPEV